MVPVTLDVTASGLYAARLDGPSGHLGFAPIIIRPQAPVQRVAIVLPTTTWQAYNYYDRNGDGFGDTWYSLFSQKRIDLARPHLRRGVPERFRSYEVQFLHWLASRGHAVDTYADEDIELFPTAEALRAAYDLIVFPGHTEYVTQRLYDLIRGYRDLGGRLIFLSANNFFRHVKRTGDVARLIGEWRDEGKPESAAARQPVPRERQRPAAGAVHRHRRRRRAVAVRGHGPRERLAVRQVRHRDRRDHPELAARHAGAGADPRPPRAGPDGADDVLRDWRTGQRSSPPASSTSAARSCSGASRAASSTTSGRGSRRTELPAAIHDQAVLAGCSGAGFVVSAT